jgi:hypothetical protein
MPRNILDEIFRSKPLSVRAKDEGAEWTAADEAAPSEAFGEGCTWAQALNVLGMADNPVKRPIAVKLWNARNDENPNWTDDQEMLAAFRAS